MPVEISLSFFVGCWVCINYKRPEGCLLLLDDDSLANQFFIWISNSYTFECIVLFNQDELDQVVAGRLATGNEGLNASHNSLGTNEDDADADAEDAQAIYDDSSNENAYESDDGRNYRSDLKHVAAGHAGAVKKELSQQNEVDERSPPPNAANVNIFFAPVLLCMQMSNGSCLYFQVTHSTDASHDEESMLEEVCDNTMDDALDETAAAATEDDAESDGNKTADLDLGNKKAKSISVSSASDDETAADVPDDTPVKVYI